MPLLSADKAREAREVIAALLDLKRFCAEAHPIYHIARPDPPVREANGRMRRNKPKRIETGDYIVRLFEGGKMRCSSEKGANDTVLEINAKLHDAVRKPLDDELKVLVNDARTAVSLESLRFLNDRIVELESLNKFGITSSGVDVYPVREGQIRFEGKDALKRATELCVSANKILNTHKQTAIDELQAKLVNLIAAI